MSYCFRKTVNLSFDEAVNKVVEEMSKEGFNLLSEINITEKFKKNLDVDFKKYKILGICNPAYGYKVLQANDNFGLFLPCNAVVFENDDGGIDVAVTNPVDYMNPFTDVLCEATEQAAELIKAAFDRI